MSSSAPSPTHHARSAPGRAARRRGPAFWIVVGAAALAALAWTADFVRRQILFEETDDAYLSGHLHIVSSRLDGTVTAVMAEENQPVAQGQALATLDPLKTSIALKRAQAALDEERAGARVAQAAVIQAEAMQAQAAAQVEAAEAKVRQAEADRRLAAVNRRREDLLFHSDVRTVSQADVDASRSAADASDAGLAAARAALAAAQAEAKVAASSIDSARARAAAAEAQAEAAEQARRDAEREASYVTIAAPATGRIGNKNVETGNRVQAGQALFAVVEGQAWVEANFKETQLRRMRPGQAVAISVDSIGGRTFAGRVESIAPATGAVFALLPPDNATGNFTKVVQRVPVKIVFDPASVAGYEDRLHPGLSAVVSVRMR